jgi:HPt (histidine-containing phosphotransfer) domain-containing protein
MDTPILDLGFLYEVSDNDPGYIREVLGLFLEMVPDKIAGLEKTVKETNDFGAIQRQAHFLKSSANIVKIRRMYENLSAMEVLARQEKGKDEIVALMDDMMVNFREAYPLILIEVEKYKPA